MNAHTLLKLQ